MAEVIRMPRMSDTMEEGVIVGWLKEEGDEIEPGDILAEVETDKATMELESYQEGVLLHIAVKEGPVPVDSIVAVIGEKGEDFQSLLEEEQKAVSGKQDEQADNGKPEEKTDSDATDTSDDSDEKDKSAEAQKVPSTPTSDDGRTKASPLARKMAAEKGIELSLLSGSGDGGRIIKRDVEKAIESGVQAPAAPSAAGISIQSGEDQTVRLSQMRKIIGKRLSESKYTSPHFYLTVEVDMDNAIAARKSLNSNDEEVRISFNDIVIKATAMALRKHPFVNASIDSEKITLHGDINIGVAVAVDEGLMVPVIHHADYKSLSEIKAEIGDLAVRARDKKLKPEEMQGNTFTISNLGMFGIDEFTAIINPPDACILAVGTINTKPVVRDGQIVIGNTMKITLSCDHRVVDGAVGAQFMQTLQDYLEHPMKMLR